MTKPTPDTKKMKNSPENSTKPQGSKSIAERMANALARILKMPDAVSQDLKNKKEIEEQNKEQEKIVNPATVPKKMDDDKYRYDISGCS